MRTTRKQLEENYAHEVKMRDLYFVALAEVLKGDKTSFRQNGIHLILISPKRADGGIVLDMTPGYPSAHYLDDLDAAMRNPTGAEHWVDYRTLLNQMLVARTRLFDVKEFVS